MPPATRYRVLTRDGLTTPRLVTMAGARHLFSMTSGALGIVEEMLGDVPPAADTVRDLPEVSP